MPDAPDPRPTPQPTGRDAENAARRQAIAELQAEEYGQVLRWALGAFGPGWEPSHRHFLQEKDEEDRCRRTGERPRAAATVYTVKNAAGGRRHFTVSGDGKVTECESYQAGFGPMLFEPHPTRGFERGGQFCRCHRYSLCWSGYELYRPRSAEQLASLRAGREHGRAERAAKKWAEDHPLLAWAEKERQTDGGPEARDRGR
jgi:hypothetical protein